MQNLDPGIAQTVALLRHWGFQTCDSGDGVTKLAEGDTDGVLDFPHVVMRVDDPSNLVAEARRLRESLDTMGITVSQQGAGEVWIEASFDPVNNTAVIFLGGMNDKLLLF
jgi:hypothetical protein